MPYLQLYSLNGLTSGMPLPIEARQAPTARNTNAVLGQLWINVDTGATYIFGGTVGGDAIWVGAGGAGVFTSLTVTTGANDINGATLINNNFNQSTGINTGTSTGSVTIKNSTGAGSVSIRTGSGAGDVNIANGTSVGTVNIGNTNTTSVNINNDVTAAARAVNIASAGNTAAFADTVSISAGVMNNAGGSQVLNLGTGNLTTGTKTVNINTGNRAAGTHTTNIATGTGTKTVNVGNADALTVINLISPVTIGAAGSPTITSGAGAPVGNQPKGSLYLRTNGTGVNDRMYVATDAVGTWTAVVTVA